MRCCPPSSPALFPPTALQGTFGGKLMTDKEAVRQVGRCATGGWPAGRSPHPSARRPPAPGQGAIRHAYLRALHCTALQVYDAHVAEVQGTVPAGQLLVFHPRQGWGPLCAFLGKEVPGEPFPRVNDTAVRRTREGREQAGRRKLGGSGGGAREGGRSIHSLISACSRLFGQGGGGLRPGCKCWHVREQRACVPPRTPASPCPALPPGVHFRQARADNQAAGEDAAVV